MNVLLCWLFILNSFEKCKTREWKIPLQNMEYMFGSLFLSSLSLCLIKVWVTVFGVLCGDLIDSGIRASLVCWFRIWIGLGRVHCCSGAMKSISMDPGHSCLHLFSIMLSESVGKSYKPFSIKSFCYLL